VHKTLLVPPDFTRAHSGAGKIVLDYFNKFDGCCDILPALGTHRPMTEPERILFFGNIPSDRYINHDWRNDTVVIGHIPADLMASLSNGHMNEAVPVEINRCLFNYDSIISIGQVVPHEIVGMANYSKNILVGCGGSALINASHMLSVYTDYIYYLGRDHSPARQMLDYAQTHFLKDLPIEYIMTVVEDNEVKGIYKGPGRDVFEKAVAHSQRVNITHVKKPIETCVVSLDEREFRTAWLGNKAIYRTRKALAKGALLIILAPGFEGFGEDALNDALIRKYGYRGREYIYKTLATQPDLAANKSVAAHLIQGSSEGDFKVVYCTRPEYGKAIRSVGYDWADINKIEWDDDAFYIDNPALGLWTV
jgi:nickel-dependent lactate racemase